MHRLSDLQTGHRRHVSHRSGITDSGEGELLYGDSVSMDPFRVPPAGWGRLASSKPSPWHSHFRMLSPSPSALIGDICVEIFSMNADQLADVSHMQTVVVNEPPHHALVHGQLVRDFLQR